jgi:hypothetical protein
MFPARLPTTTLLEQYQGHVYLSLVGRCILKQKFSAELTLSRFVSMQSIVSRRRHVRRDVTCLRCERTIREAVSRLPG